LFVRLFTQELISLFNIKRTKFDATRLMSCAVIRLILICVFRIMLAYGVYKK